MKSGACLFLIASLKKQNLALLSYPLWKGAFNITTLSFIFMSHYFHSIKWLVHSVIVLLFTCGLVSYESAMKPNSSVFRMLPALKNDI